MEGPGGCGGEGDMHPQEERTHTHTGGTHRAPCAILMDTDAHMHILAVVSLVAVWVTRVTHSPGAPKARHCMDTAEPRLSCSPPLNPT